MITYETKKTHPGTSAITYETKSTHPTTLPSATIYLGGLLCLSFDHANRCTVGVNNLVGNGHTWKFSIVDPEPEPDKPMLACKQGSSDLSEIYIDVQGGTTGGAYVYNGNGPVSIPSIDEQRFNLESSWIDLEGPRGHNRKVENDANTLWPRFYINDALFSASKLSTASFALKNSTSTKYLGPIALAVVADIFLDTSDPLSKIKVKLKYGRVSKTISLDKQKRYEIYITNDCGYDYSSAGPLLRSDFHLHYKAFSGAFPGGRGMNTNDQFHLVSNTMAKGETESNRAQAEDNYIPLPLTDKAPCMAVVLGQTSNFNA